MTTETTSSSAIIVNREQVEVALNAFKARENVPVDITISQPSHLNRDQLQVTASNIQEMLGFLSYLAFKVKEDEMANKVNPEEARSTFDYFYDKIMLTEGSEAVAILDFEPDFLTTFSNGNVL